MIERKSSSTYLHNDYKNYMYLLFYIVVHLNAYIPYI